MHMCFCIPTVHLDLPTWLSEEMRSWHTRPLAVVWPSRSHVAMGCVGPAVRQSLALLAAGVCRGLGVMTGSGLPVTCHLVLRWLGDNAWWRARGSGS